MNLKEQYKFLLTEEIVDTIKTSNATFEIYKNPSFSEMKYIQDNARGILDKDGNLFVLSNLNNDDMPYYAIHKEIMTVLFNKELINKQWKDILRFNQGMIGWIDPESDIIPVQRYKESMDIYLSESINPNDINNFVHLEKILNKAKELNSHLNFHKKRKL